MRSGEWNKFVNGAYATTGSSIDTYLTEHGGTPMDGEQYTSLQKLIEPVRDCMAGTRVEYLRNVSAFKDDTEAPVDGLRGTIVTVRSRNAGDITSFKGKVFVSWDDGSFRPVYAENLMVVSEKESLKVRKACTKLVRRAMDLTAFVTADDNTLIQKATKDLWSFRKDGDSYVIERLFDETGKPLKV